MDTSILRKIGLTNNEIKVYLTLLELGSVPAGELIKKVELHRTAVYDMLERLLEKGLISYAIVSNVKHFEAIDPNQLLSYVDQRKDELEDYSKEIEKVLPELELKRKLAKEPLEATIFKGKQGVKSMFEDILRTKQTLHVYGAEGRFKEFFPIYYHHFHKKRVGSKIKIRIIYKESVRKEKRATELKLIEMRYLPNEFDTPATTMIYGDKVTIVIWGDQPIVTLIRSGKIAKSYLSNFELLWSIAKE